jgi:hypothetical protein
MNCFCALCGINRQTREFKHLRTAFDGCATQNVCLFLYLDSSGSLYGLLFLLDPLVAVGGREPSFEMMSSGGQRIDHRWTLNEGSLKLGCRKPL